MSDWQFEITREAEEDLTALDRPVRKRVLARLAWFVDHFEEVSPIPLAGYWRGYFKLRAGDWRIIYSIEKAAVYVKDIRHRREVYWRK